MRTGVLVLILAVAASAGGQGRRSLVLDPRSVKTLHTLEPLMAQRARKFLMLVKRRYRSLDVRAIMGTRTYPQQDALYAIGRSVPGRPVTNARGGQSNHNFNIAFDIGVFEVGGYQTESPWYAKLGDLADEAELAWGGNWRSRLVDRPHYQWPTELSLAELRRLKANNELISEQPSSLIYPDSERAMRFQTAPPPTQETLYQRVKQFVTLAEDPSLASLDAVRAAMPGAVHLADPVWMEDDQAVGSVVKVTGPIQGILVYGSASDTGLPPLDTSHLEQIQIYLGDSIKGDLRTIGREIRKFMSKRLHISESEAPTTVPNRDDLPGVSGYRASWKLKKGRLDLWQHWYGHKWVLCFYLADQDQPSGG